MKSILWIILAHYLLDFPLQGEFLTQTKGNYFYSLLAHSMIYSLGMALCFELIGVFAIWKVLILIVSHLVIDEVKANAEDKKKALTTHLYIDQALHILIDLILFAL
jgi:hypothetical protein